MTGDRTLAVYDAMAGEYTEKAAAWPPAGLDTFLGMLTPGARVLDLGCGPGHHAAMIAAAGFDVLAVDGASEMVARATRHRGVTARQATFDDIPDLGRFGGIWASFSLLHAPRSDFPQHLRALHVASDPGAPLGLGMKLGSGEGPDRLDRHYTYYSETQLRDHLAIAGFTPVDALTGTDKGFAGTTDPWILFLAHA